MSFSLEDSPVSAERTLEHSETVVGKRELGFVLRNGEDPDIAMEGQTVGDRHAAAYLREMTVAKLDEDILDSIERGDTTSAQAVEAAKDFLVGLETSEASEKELSFIGLAEEKILRLQDLLSADSIDPNLRMELEYKLKTAENAVSMLRSKSGDLTQKRVTAARDGKEREVLVEEATSHNSRVKRNMARREALESSS